MKRYYYFDNNGESFDRYTMLDTKTGDLQGASENPFHPQGFGQYCGNACDFYWNAAYGASWRRDITPKLLRSRELFAIRNWLNDTAHIGKPVELSSLPIPVKKFFNSRK